MTQDTSRDFLSGSGEVADRKKHQLFMEVGRQNEICHAEVVLDWPVCSTLFAFDSFS